MPNHQFTSEQLARQAEFNAAAFTPEQHAIRESMRCATLSFVAKNREHELFRSCMSSVVALRQGWSAEAMAAQADRLEACARKFIASDKFK